MFYLILAIMLVLFYIFAAPNHIKGTINLMVAVFFLVGLCIALLLAFLKVLEFPSQVWLGLITVLIGLWAMRDIYCLDKDPGNKEKKSRRSRSYRYR